MSTVHVQRFHPETATERQLTQFDCTRLFMDVFLLPEAEGRELIQESKNLTRRAAYAPSVKLNPALCTSSEAKGLATTSCLSRLPRI